MEKQRRRALERIQDIERIQKYNQSKLQKEIENIEYKKKYLTKNEALHLKKQEERLEQYSSKIKILEKNFFQI